MQPTKFEIWDYWRGGKYALNYGAVEEKIADEQSPYDKRFVIDIPDLFAWLQKMGGAIQLKPPYKSGDLWFMYYSHDGRFGQR